MRRVPGLIAFFCLLFAYVAPAQQQNAVPPEEAPRRMSLPQGFTATLFAGEPDVVQPIGFTIDDRGRLWVAESHAYPDWEMHGKPGKDRILIFDDTDGDGRHDSRKVFIERGTNFSGIEVGFGGAWVTAPPFLLFIPDRDGDDVPDGEPQVVLDGWNIEDAKHNVVNGLTWGPDGWLYGCNGIMAPSFVGTHDTPEEKRVYVDCGVWRYHPTKKTFEVVAHGTTNPWGLDFDDFGQMFITNCVISHLWHVVPGGHYKRMYGQDANPYSYALMESCADHLHWGGGDWTSSRGGLGKHGEAGGGHAHVGAMVYLGDNWPDRYRNTLFTCNLHGNRVNNDVLRRKGSGYVATHAPDFLLAHDTFFRGLELAYGPDGGVYLTDWSDTGECHDYDEAKRESGRIFKVTHGKSTPFRGDVAKLSDQELFMLQFHRNDWFVRRARLALQQRSHEGKLGAGTKTELVVALEHPEASRRLRALWALHAIGSLDDKLIAKLLRSDHESVRGWTIQLELEDGEASPAVAKTLIEMARNDRSPVVQLYLASALQRLAPEQRWPLAEALAARPDNAKDANLPLMIWYGIEPLVSTDKRRAVSLMTKAKIPIVREHIARRVASKDEPIPAPEERSPQREPADDQPGREGNSSPSDGAGGLPNSQATKTAREDR